MHGEVVVVARVVEGVVPVVIFEVVRACCRRCSRCRWRHACRRPWGRGPRRRSPSMPPWMAAGAGATALPRSSPGLPIPFVQGRKTKCPSRRTHPGARSIVVVSIVSWDGGANGPGANGPVCSARARLLRRRAPSSYDRSRCLRCPGDCSVTTQISRNRLRLPAAHFYAISTVHL